MTIRSTDPSAQLLDQLTVALTTAKAIKTIAKARFDEATKTVSGIETAIKSLTVATSESAKPATSPATATPEAKATPVSAVAPKAAQAAGKGGLS